MCARTLVMFMSMQHCGSTEVGPRSCEVINFNISGSMDSPTPWQIGDLNAFSKWNVTARISVQPSLQLHSKRGFLRFAVQTASPEGLYYECANTTMNGESLAAFMFAGVGQDCPNAGKLILRREYHPSGPGALDTLFEIGLFKIKVWAQVCYTAVLPSLCTMGLPGGPGVLHNCHDVRKGLMCNARCNSSTHSGASRAYQCLTEGRLAPVLNDVQCDPLVTAASITGLPTLDNDGLYFWLYIALPLACVLLPLVVGVCQHITGFVPWPCWLYHHFRSPKDPLPDLIEDWSRMQQCCLRKYYEKCAGCSGRAPHWVLKTHLPVENNVVLKCKLCMDEVVGVSDIQPPLPPAPAGEVGNVV